MEKHYEKHILICVFTLLTMFCKVLVGQNSQEYAYSVLDSFLSNTCFPDSLYEEYDFKSFFELEVIKQKIDTNNVDYGLLNAAVFYATNEVRIKKRKSSFIFSRQLRDVAFFHSFLMEKNNFYSHKNIMDKQLRTMTDRLEFFNVGYKKNQKYYVSENIYNYYLLNYKEGKSYKFKDDDENGAFYYVNRRGEKISKIEMNTYESMAKNLVHGWMKSKGHRKNILNRRSCYFGAGVVVNSRSLKYRKFPEVYATQLFSLYVSP